MNLKKVSLVIWIHKKTSFNDYMCIVLENLGVVYENEDEYMEYFDTIDINQDGKISYEEFEQVLYDCYEEPTENQNQEDG